MGIWTDLFEPLLCTQSGVMQTLVLQALYGLSLGTATKLTESAVLSLVTEKRGDGAHSFDYLEKTRKFQTNRSLIELTVF